MKLSPLNTGSAMARSDESLGATLELKTRSGCQDARVMDAGDLKVKFT